MDYTQTVLFSDLDATLFNSRGEVSPENLAAIRMYEERGGRFAVSTGRQPDNALHYLPGVISNAPSVVLNGAATYDFATGEYGNCVYLDRGTLWNYLDAVLSGIPDADVQTYVRAGIRYITPLETAEPHLLSLHDPCAYAPPSAMREEDVFKCLLYVAPAREEELLSILRPGDGRDFVLMPGTTDVGGQITYYELLPLNASKGVALNALRAHPALRGRTFLAVGDYWNDYDMLRAADVAVAPDNAIDEVKAVCQYVTVSNNDHAVAKIITDLIPSL